MNAETIVVGLEQAKMLKDAGWPQYQGEDFGWFQNAISEWAVHYVELFPEDDHMAAPTAEEILRRLPRTIEGHSKKKMSFGKRAVSLNIGKSPDGEWLVAYRGKLGFPSASLANASAAMFCYLVEHKLLNA